MIAFSFAYNNQPLLNDFSLSIKKGETVALVGESGSGKTTLANLINRFYDVQKGAVTIDGIDIKEISKENLRQLVGIVTQEALLFNDSIANNLRLGRPKATDEEMIEATKIANAHEFIMELPEVRYQYRRSWRKIIRGAKTATLDCTGYSQNPAILVLDEATSALDSASEKLVQEALEKLMQDRTSLVIAHRLSTIQRADKIVVLDHGKILEVGNHETLMKKEAAYAALVHLQRL